MNRFGVLKLFCVFYVLIAIGFCIQKEWLKMLLSLSMFAGNLYVVNGFRWLK